MNAVGADEPAAEPLGGFFINTVGDDPVCGVCDGDIAEAPVSIEEILAEAAALHEQTKQRSCTCCKDISGIGGQKISLGVDSGAAVTVIPESWCQDYPLLPNAESKRGHAYRTAGGAAVPDLGTRALVGQMNGGAERGLKARVAKVVKGLVSVYEQTQAGHVVVFSKGRSFCKHDGNGEFMKAVMAEARKHKGKELDFHVRNRTYEIDMEIKPYDSLKQEFKVASVEQLSSFSRQAKP